MERLPCLLVYFFYVLVRGLCNAQLCIDIAQRISKSHLESSAKSMLFLGIISAIAGTAIIFSNFKNNDDNKDRLKLIKWI